MAAKFEFHAPAAQASLPPYPSAARHLSLVPDLPPQAPGCGHDEPFVQAPTCRWEEPLPCLDGALDAGTIDAFVNVWTMIAAGTDDTTSRQRAVVACNRWRAVEPRSPAAASPLHVEPAREPVISAAPIECTPEPSSDAAPLEAAPELGPEPVVDAAPVELERVDAEPPAGGHGDPGALWETAPLEQPAASHGAAPAFDVAAYTRAAVEERMASEPGNRQAPLVDAA